MFALQETKIKDMRKKELELTLALASAQEEEVRRSSVAQEADKAMQERDDLAAEVDTLRRENTELRATEVREYSSPVT